MKNEPYQVALLLFRRSEEIAPLDETEMQLLREGLNALDQHSHLMKSAGIYPEAHQMKIESIEKLFKKLCQ